MVRIISTELNPVILTPNNTFRTRILSVTTAMDRPRERAILSITFICLPLKNTSVQAKPGRKKTNVIPSIALRMGKRSSKGKTSPVNSLSGDSQSTPCISSPSILHIIPSVTVNTEKPGL